MIIGCTPANKLNGLVTTTGAERVTMVLPVLLSKDCMRYLTLVLVLIIATACTTKPQPKPYLTMEQLRNYQVTQADCPNIERKVAQLEQNQQEAGIPRTAPELLPEPDREYQARTRIAIWALRIGCNNPDRYTN